jgi:hypothetical protein
VRQSQRDDNPGARILSNAKYAGDGHRDDDRLDDFAIVDPIAPPAALITERASSSIRSPVASMWTRSAVIRSRSLACIGLMG